MTSVSLRQPGGGASSVPAITRAAADLQADVVDQPRRPDTGGHQQHGRPAVAGPDLLEAIRIGKHQVVEYHGRICQSGLVENGAGRGQHGCRPRPATVRPAASASARASADSALGW